MDMDTDNNTKKKFYRIWFGIPGCAAPGEIEEFLPLTDEEVTMIRNAYDESERLYGPFDGSDGYHEAICYSDCLSELPIDWEALHFRYNDMPLHDNGDPLTVTYVALDDYEDNYNLV